MFQEKRKFKNSKGLIISAVWEGEEKNSTTVVLAHGYVSSKDSTSTKTLAQKLVVGGLNVFRFDFTGCGESEGTIQDLTPLQGLDDLKNAVKNLNKSKFALYGSSFGGHVALVYAAKNPVAALGLKAPVSDYSEVIARHDDLNREARSEEFLEEVKNIDIYKLAKNIKSPTLIVHGGEDDVVPLAQSEKLAESLGGEKRLAVIHDATHDIKGPDLEDATNLLSEFFLSTLLPSLKI